MADSDPLKLIATPIPDFVAAVANAIVQAQVELDKATLKTLRDIQNQSKDEFKDLREIGYRPTWYTIPMAEAEIKLLFHYEKGEKTDDPWIWRVIPFNATTQAATKISAEGTSQLKFRILPVPPPAATPDGEKE